MDNNIEKVVFQNFKQNSHLTTILLYPAVETIDDPYEKNTTKAFLNPVPIKGVVKSISPESLRWRYFGTLPMGSKQVICEKKYEALFKMADKIQIGEDYFKTWKDESKGWGIIEREDYIVVVMEKKVI